MAKKQSKSGSQKKRLQKKRGSKVKAPSDAEFNAEIDNDYGDIGTMGSLLGGFRRAVGAPGEASRAKTWKDHIWSIAILLLLVGLAAFALSGR